MSGHDVGGALGGLDLRRTGAGKSVAAWALVERLTGDGQRVAYVDIDQLGMLYPAADDDPQRHQFKAEALRELLPGYALAGARLVVSGVIDPARGPSPGLTSDVRMASSPAATGVVVITGPRASGTSTVAFGLAMDRWRAGPLTGFVDLQQIGFIAGGTHTHVTEPALAIHQLAVMHTLMTARGAELLVVSGHLTARTHDAVRDALPSAPVDVVRLRGNKATIEGHVRSRARGSGARLAGDDLLGASSAHQADRVATALSQQELLGAGAAEDLVLDVGGRSPADVVFDVERFLARSRR